MLSQTPQGRSTTTIEGLMIPPVRPNDLVSLRRTVEEDSALSRLQSKARELAAADPNGFDPGHDLAHANRVALWTLRLAPAVDARWCIAAALLHDAVNIPKDSPQRSSASEMSASVARDLLPELDFCEQAVATIAEAVRDHSYSRGATPESDLGKALQDADRLEAVGALGLCRTLSCGAKMGAAYFDPDDPWAAERPLDDTAFTVDHFFAKLLQLPKTMNTETGRAEAERRANWMRGFLAQLGVEIETPFSERSQRD